MAKSDPALFLQRHKPPIIIDEVQYAPELFSAIKLLVDQKKENGLFWLAGSQKFELMQAVSETLAGRVGVCELLGLSGSEVSGNVNNVKAFLPSQEYISDAFGRSAPVKDLNQIYHDIWIGSFPKLVADVKMSRDVFYSSYIQTYVERDVRLLSQITSILHFQRFLKVAAARTAQLVNYADMARDVDVDQKTIKAWLSILEASGLIYLLKPYHNNLTNRLIKAPKLYFLDTGLCSYLTGWSSAQSLERGSMSGAILETYVLSEMLKSYCNTGVNPSLYFYRDKDQKEIDFLIEFDQCLHLVECKKTATPSAETMKNFHVLDRLKVHVGQSVVFCFKDKPVSLAKDVTALPISYI